MVKKIVVIGPESTGKSTLCERLAAHYNTIWVPEYAREFLLTNGTSYAFEDLLTIAKGQIELEEAATNAAEQLLFIDTDMYVMKVWSEFVFEARHNWVEEQLKQRRYDLYLLCDVDLPWTKDELREYPDLETRRTLFNIYHKLMQEQATPWVLIQGDYEERFRIAIEAVDSMK